MTRTMLRRKGQITLPPEVRETLHVEEGDEIEFEITDDGDVVMHGLKMILADQAWFWTGSWQRGEREADADIKAGRVSGPFESAEEMFDALDRNG